MDIGARIQILRTIKRNIQTSRQALVDALSASLGKCEFESYACEIGTVLDEIRYAIKHIRSFCKVRRVATPLKLWGSKSLVYRVPYGKVLVISPWNYPFMLSLVPVVEAIAMGNSVTLKMSEESIAVYNVVRAILEGTGVDVVDPSAVSGIDILRRKWDYIFFTGSTRVGREVMRVASDNLTPVTLELGGKSPTIILPSSDLDLAAKKIAWGKFVCAGQTCVAPDYVLVQESDKAEFVARLIAYIKQFYTDNALSNECYPKIVNDRHYDRIMSLIDDTVSVAYGGKGDRVSRRIEPTVVYATMQSTIMQDEIFGAILPIIAVQGDIETVCKQYIIDEPLALYVFGDKRIAGKLASDINSGGVCINDVLVHVANHHLPFGGVGSSGLGRYHGRYGLETFARDRAVVVSHRSKDLNLRYPPYDNKRRTLGLLKWLSGDRR